MCIFLNIDYLKEWFNKSTYKNYWTYPGFPRDSQLKILFQVNNALKKGYRNLVIEAGTGTGKSAISTTIANKYAPAYILTKTVNLQEQYMQEYPRYLCELKGKKNYPCWYKGNQYKRYTNTAPEKYSCEECYIEHLNEYGDIHHKREVLNEHGRDFNFYYEGITQREYDRIVDEMMLWKCKDCQYTQAIKNAKKHDIVIANYHSLYYNSYFIPRFPKRNMILFDECHNFEEIMMNIPVIKLNASQLYDKFHIDVLNADPEQLESTRYWIDTLKYLIEKITLQKEHNINNLKHSHIDDNIIKQISMEWDNQINTYQKNYDSLSIGEWVSLIDGEKICFKPVYGKPYAHRLLDLGTIRIFLSGTLPLKSKFLRWLGLNKKNTFFINEKSPFPLSNRPIIKQYLGNFKSKNDEYIDGERIPAWKNNKVITGITSILDNHPYEKGVIHTTSKEQCLWLKEQLTSLDYNVFTAFNDADNKLSREEQINLFKNNPLPGVLISPSIKEGVDFKGDLCTFQIIFKIPNPYYGDLQVRTRAGKHDGWYNFMTTVPLMQAYGRGIRSSTDTCTCYVIDQDFESLLHKGKNYFCEYFLEAIE